MLNDKHAVYGILIGLALGDAHATPQRGRKAQRESAATQLALFTAEGVIRAFVRFDQKGICALESVVHHGLVRWLHTQGARGLSTRGIEESWPDGWLVKRAAMNRRRYPSASMMRALMQARSFGDAAVRDDTDDDRAMLVHLVSVGLALQPNEAYAVASRVACFSTGNWEAAYGGACIAHIVALVASGAGVDDAVRATRDRLEQEHYSDTTLSIIARVLSSPNMTRPQDGPAWQRELEVGLSVALTCSSVHDALARRPRIARHSRSGFALGCALLGAREGVSKCTLLSLRGLELALEILVVARALYRVRVGWPRARELARRFPGW